MTVIKKILSILFLSSLILTVNVNVVAQGNSAPPLKWNHDAIPSFREPVKKEEVKDFLPYFPAKA